MIPTEALNGNKVSPAKNGPKKLKKSDSESTPSWLTTSAITAALENDVRVMLLCGADMFETFVKPNLWKTEHVGLINFESGNIVFEFEFSAGGNHWKLWRCRHAQGRL